LASYQSIKEPAVRDDNGCKQKSLKIMETPRLVKIVESLIQCPYGYCYCFLDRNRAKVRACIKAICDHRQWWGDIPIVAQQYFCSHACRRLFSVSNKDTRRRCEHCRCNQQLTLLCVYKTGDAQFIRADASYPGPRYKIDLHRRKGGRYTGSPILKYSFLWK